MLSLFELIIVSAILAYAVRLVKEGELVQALAAVFVTSAAISLLLSSGISNPTSYIHDQGMLDLDHVRGHPGGKGANANGDDDFYAGIEADDLGAVVVHKLAPERRLPALLAGPTPTRTSTTTERSQTRSGGTCAGCASNSSGPCMHEALPVCFPFKRGTTECEPRTVRCKGAGPPARAPAPAAQLCQGCEANTNGPCKHELLPLCFPFAPGTQTCEERTHPCAKEPAVAPQAPVGGSNGAARPDFVIVTGASKNHECPLINMLGSLTREGVDTPVIIYELGTEAPFLDTAELKKAYAHILEFRKFDYSKYPDWFKIDYRAGEYAWKPMIIREVVDEFGEALWVDSGNKAMPGRPGWRLDMNFIREKLIGPTGFYSPKSPQSPFHWVHAGTFEYFGMKKCCADPKINPNIKRKPCCCCGTYPPAYCMECNKEGLQEAKAAEWLKKPMCNGALVGVKKGTPGYDKILAPWHECALKRECIAPKGPGGESHRGNHRQDQSAFTMLMILNDTPCKGKEMGAGFRLHQDNRHTNTTFCKLVRDGVVQPPAQASSKSPMQPMDKPREKPPAVPFEPNSQQYPLTAKDLLTKTCVDRHRPAGWRQTPVADGQPHLTHVINPFPTKDLHFNWSIPAITAAYKNAQKHGIRIQVVGISFSNEKVDLPDFITHLPILDPERVAGKYLQEEIGIEFGSQEIPLRGPIVYDVFSEMYKIAKTETLVWTNFDLIVREDFYTMLYDITTDPVKKLGSAYKSLAGVSVLRADVLLSRARYPTLSHLTVDGLFDHNNTQRQAGHDTFMFPRHWIPCLDMRHMAFGVGGWDHAVYSQFKQLAHHDGVQFRTLDTSRIAPKPGATEAPVPPRTTGGGLDKWIKNSVRPGYGLVRHIGSQIANVKTHWTNPVSWKGLGRSIQYGANKRLKYEIEVYIQAVRGMKHVCKRKYMRQCQASDANNVIDGMPSDGRIIGVAASSPAKDGDYIKLFEAMTGLRAGSAHEKDLTKTRRDSVVALLTHAKDMYPGPKGPNVLHPLPVPDLNRKKGPLEFRGVVLIMEEPVAAIEAWYVSLPTYVSSASVEEAKVKLLPLVAQYNEFWIFWIERFARAVTYMMILNLVDVDEDALSTELMILEEFIQLHRCGRGGSREWRACNGGGASERPNSGRVCCALHQHIGTVLATTTNVDTKHVQPEVQAWIKEQTLDVTQQLRKVWATSRGRYEWPSVAKCCKR